MRTIYMLLVKWVQSLSSYIVLVQTKTKNSYNVSFCLFKNWILNFLKHELKKIKSYKLNMQ